MSEKLSTNDYRRIIENFAKEIKERKETGSKPEDTVIYFRNDKKVGRTRPIYLVPCSLLRFRKDNGRIASDVASYQKLNGTLDETKDNTQEILRGFLKAKDEENNIKLNKSISHDGQREPAIITCDGFLINGNRRKMTLDELGVETMKVVILPDKGEEGGPPTIKEIEEIENRYQLQSDGKSEYTNFDRAISIKRKIIAGLSLEDQLKDDPSLVGLTDKEFKKELTYYQNWYLGPLECIDRYLEQLDRKGLYDNISEGRNDREGRWYSFIDYYSFHKQLRNEDGELTKYALDLGIEDDETGDIENVAFKIIRKKTFPENFPIKKTNDIIRKLSKIIENPLAKKELMRLKNVPDLLSKSEHKPEDTLDTIDKKWGSSHETAIIGGLKRALQILDYEKDRETPITLLEDALKKLNHPGMDLPAILLDKMHDAMKLAREVSKRAGEIETELYHLEKDSKHKLKNRNSSKHK